MKISIRRNRISIEFFYDQVIWLSHVYKNCLKFKNSMYLIEECKGYVGGIFGKYCITSLEFRNQKELQIFEPEENLEESRKFYLSPVEIQSKFKILARASSRNSLAGFLQFPGRSFEDCPKGGGVLLVRRRNDNHKSSRDDHEVAGARNMETWRPVQMTRDNVFPPSVFCQARLPGPGRFGQLKNYADPF